MLLGPSLNPAAPPAGPPKASGLVDRLLARPSAAPAPLSLLLRVRKPPNSKSPLSPPPALVSSPSKSGPNLVVPVRAGACWRARFVGSAGARGLRGAASGEMGLDLARIFAEAFFFSGLLSAPITSSFPSGESGGHGRFGSLFVAQGGFPQGFAWLRLATRAGLPPVRIYSASLTSLLR